MYAKTNRLPETIVDGIVKLETPDERYGYLKALKDTETITQDEFSTLVFEFRRIEREPEPQFHSWAIRKTLETLPKKAA